MNLRASFWAGLVVLPLFPTIPSNIHAMMPSPETRNLKVISPHCRFQGAEAERGLLETAACKQLTRLLADRFGAGVPIEPLGAGDPKMFEPNRLLVTISGRIPAAAGITGKIVTAGIQVLRNGTSSRTVPTPPRAVIHTGKTLSEADAKSLAAPLVEDLFTDRFGRSTNNDGRLE